jgi:uncharacterized membrane protein
MRNRVWKILAFVTTVILILMGVCLFLLILGFLVKGVMSVWGQIL